MSDNVVSLPTVSVVVCVHNEDVWLEKCLKALLRQEYDKSRYEIIIVDDESSDRSPEIALKVLAEAQNGVLSLTYIRVPHGGLSVARNVGIETATGQIVAFIDGDAIAREDWLSRLVQPFSEGADFAGGRIELLNTESPVARFAQLTRHKQVLGPDVVINGLVGCNMAYRATVFASVGGFYENFVSRGDETTLYQRVHRSFRYAPAPDAVVYHERPERMSEWLRTEWRAAVLYGLTRKAEEGRSIKRAMAALEEAGFAVLPLCALLAWQSPALFGPLLGMSIVCAVRRLLFRPIVACVLNGMLPVYGYVRSVAGYVLFAYVTTVVVSIGRPFGIALYWGKTLIPPFTTKTQPLDSLHVGTGNGLHYSPGSGNVREA